jgi:hypothetical protein
MPNYLVTEDFDAPKKESEENGDKLKRLFRKGEFISGKPNGYAKYKGDAVHVVEQKEGYLIPAKFLKQVDTEYGDTGEQAQVMNEKVSQIMNKDLVSGVMTTARTSMKGVVIGAFAGFTLALIKKESLLWLGIFGAVSGGLIGYGIGKYNTNNKN